MRADALAEHMKEEHIMLMAGIVHYVTLISVICKFRKSMVIHDTEYPY